MGASAAERLTVGIDIGTTAVKAVAVTRAGDVAARVRIPHKVHADGPNRLEHDALKAWAQGPRKALDAVCADLSAEADVAGVCVAAMVPSLTAVDGRGVPRIPGLLYGDSRGSEPAGPQRAPADGEPSSGAPGPMVDAVGFLRWAAAAMPGAAGYWPAQAVANYALAGLPTVDTAVTTALGSLHTMGAWNGDLLASMGVAPESMPEVVLMGAPAGELPGASAAPGAALAGGTVDALCDQLVAGATGVGDVLVLCGATLVVWVVTDDWIEVPGLWTVPHTVPGRVLVGGPSNAGALFVDWARVLLGMAPGSVQVATPAGRDGDPSGVPVWLPYLRGERVLHDNPQLRAAAVDLDITHGRDAALRGVYEASGFVVRAVVEATGIAPRRIVVSGGGSRSRPWMEAMADATSLAVEAVAVPEGAALGAAWLARVAAGLEEGIDGAGSWARPGRRYEPDPVWSTAADGRYRRFRAATAQEVAVRRSG